MIARWLAGVAGLAALLALSPSTAQDLPRHVFTVEPEDEVQDILFLGETRPLLVRLHIQVDGRGYRDRWLAFVRRLHRAGDVNADGVLSRSEAYNAVNLIYRAQFPSAQTIPPRRALLLPPEVVGVDDLADQVRTVAPSFAIQRAPAVDPATEEATFALLDRDHDGYLSRDELATVAASLSRLDLDDDEIVTAQEMSPDRNLPVNNGVLLGVPGSGPVPPSAAGGAVISASLYHPGALARQIIRRYDARPRPTPSSPLRVPVGSGGDGRLQSTELRVEREAFDRLDADRDGSIDATELEKAVTDAADIELIVRLGQRETGQPAVERVEGKGGRSPFGGPSARRVGDTILIEMPVSAVEVRVEGEGEDSISATQTVYLNQFPRLDMDRNKFLDRNEAGVSFMMRAVFDLADRDGDGKLTEAELNAHFDRQAELAGLRTVLTAAEQGPSFLDILDTDRDRRLGPRELRRAEKRLLLEDRDGDGRVALSEFVRFHRWTFGRGQAVATNQPPIIVDAPARSLRSPGVPLPAWFLKMDRNRDGDLSPREFLGTRATFEALDTDGDGLIAPLEAIRRP